MPSTEPGPVGTFSAYALQPEPIRAPAGAAAEVVVAADDTADDIAEVASVAAVFSAVSLRPAR